MQTEIDKDDTIPNQDEEATIETKVSQQLSYRRHFTEERTTKQTRAAYTSQWDPSTLNETNALPTGCKGKRKEDTYC
jgi:hypothetical protein